MATNLVPELNSLDFNVYIGGPLQACVQAQTAASMATVNFIKEVGFEPNTGAGVGDPDVKLRYVDFSYAKSTPNPHFGKLPADLTAEGLPSNTDTTNAFSKTTVAIQVPFLTMLVMPAIRIEEINVEFNAKLSSVETSNVSNEFAASASVSAGWLRVINFKASASYKQSSTSGVSVEKTYTLGVRVRAVNDELPAGLERILTMLEDSITSVNG
jgi:hypothetical protein